MILLVDAGNSRLKWAAATADTWQLGEPLPLHAGAPRPPPEWRAWDPERVVVASVAGSAVDTLVEGWANALWGRRAEFVRTQDAIFGLRIGYREPSRLGVDRWAALVGAHCAGMAPACVFDCGTALTVDVLGRGGHHHGGWIVPGPRLMREALLGRTAGIAAAAAEQGPDAAGVFGRDTVTGIEAGARAALAGLAARAVAEAEHLCGEPVASVVTGGDADWLTPCLAAETRHVPDLVLRGLAYIAGLEPCGAVT